VVTWRRVRITLAIVGGLAAVALLAFAFAAQMLYGPRVIRVAGHSMSPTLQDDDRAIVFKRVSEIRRGDVIAHRYPKDPTKSFVYRVVGLPGERVSMVDGDVRIDGRSLSEPYIPPTRRGHSDLAGVQLGADEYFVLGDNRTNAADSREWGPVPRRLIWARLGWVWYRGQPRK
jgi:signal peptidase I